MRLDKLLANMGYGTRNEIKKAVKARRITVNGEVAKKADLNVDEYNDEITMDEEPIIYEKYTYFMLNKPAGVISATEGNQETVMDLIYEPIKGLFPVGRLDKDTEGLLLITNNGPLAHDLLSPKKHVEKEYEVHLRDPIEDDYQEKLSKGIVIDGGEQCKPAKLIPVDDTICHLVITEGKFHEVKRMFEALGNEVIYLKRLRMKKLVLDENLKPGEYRYLSQEEIDDLNNVTKEEGSHL